MSYLRSIHAQVLNLQIIEFTAVAFNITYVILAWYQKKACWLFGAIGSALSIYYFQHEEIRLYAESGLYAFYVAVSLYGWWAWSRPEQNEISELRLSKHILLIISGITLSIILSELTGHYTDAARPFADSLSTVFGVLATFLTIRKVLSNWIYWIAIDLFSVWLYLARHSEIYAAQMFLFAGLAVYGYFQWRQEFRSKASVSQ